MTLSSFLPGGAALAAFLAASLVLAATPGPGVVYIVARTLSQGRAAGVASVLGVAAGNLGNALGASLGLAALFAVSSLAFDAVRLAGAAYLVVLGLMALRRRGDRPAESPLAPAPPRLRTIARDGFVVALLNPKTALFFAAFLPQFIDPAGAPAAEGAVLGAAFVAIALVTDTAYVLAAHLVAGRLAGDRRFADAGRYLSAATYIGLGIATAALGSRPQR